MFSKPCGKPPVVLLSLVVKWGIKLFPLLGLLISGPTIAGDWEWTGIVAGEVRFFPSAPAFPFQSGATVSPSFSLQTSFYYEWNEGRDRLTFAPFGRWDMYDDNRSHADLREASWLHIGDSWDLVIGLGKVFWGVSESRHLVDVVNQDDGVEDIDGEDKLGQPMVNLNLIREWGRISVFLLPGFRERTFPASGARLSGPVRIAVANPVFESSTRGHHIDFAARWAQSVGNWDIGIAHFHGTSREPRLISHIGNSGQIELVPYYDQIDQSSLDLQLTKGAWLLKLEAMSRSGQGKRFLASVAGLEYTIFGIFGTSSDLGLLAEYLYDGRDMDRAPVTAFEDDIFLGTRVAWNDIQDTSALLGAVVDRKTGGLAIFVEAERRFGDSWRVEIEGRLFFDISGEDSLASIRRDDTITLRLSKFF